MGKSHATRVLLLRNSTNIVDGVMVATSKFQVIKDTREQAGWFFPPSSSCQGTVIQTLKTGDYTIKGFETTFVIERKGSTSEWSQNLLQPRFARELDRLDAFENPFIVLEFTLSDLLRFPINSGIPKFKWKYLKVTGEFLLKRTLEIQLKHKAQLIFAGSDGFQLSWSLFKRVQEGGGNEA